MNPFARHHVAVANELKQSGATLCGIVLGLLADGDLNDKEIRFLRDWLTANDAIANHWPGDVLRERLDTVLIDGNITPAERQHFSDDLRKLVGMQDPVCPGEMATADAPVVSRLPIDDDVDIRFSGRFFCLTGDFAFGPREACEAAIIRRGGQLKAAVSKKIDFVVVGGLGSKEWKHGGYGTKVEHAVELQREGAKLRIVHEDSWAEALRNA